MFFYFTFDLKWILVKKTFVTEFTLYVKLTKGAIA